jgi:hypothetical protein
MNLFEKNRAAIAAFVLSSLVHSDAQSISRKTFQFKPLTIAQAKAIEKKLDRKQLPSGVDIGNPEVYRIRSPDREDLNVIPVSFTYNQTSGPPALPEQCGVFFLKPHGESHYLPVVGPSPVDADACETVLAVGAMTDPSPRPRLIFLFHLFNVHGSYYRRPYILSWNQTSGTYEIDQKTSNWLLDQERRNTIPQIRKLLAQHP